MGNIQVFSARNQPHPDRPAAPVACNTRHASYARCCRVKDNMNRLVRLACRNFRRRSISVWTSNEGGHGAALSADAMRSTCACFLGG